MSKDKEQIIARAIVLALLGVGLIGGFVAITYLPEK
jgi:hypothetical protein